jgi:hypothetical protein
MDGVLVDFVAGMVKAHGLAANPYDDPQWAGEYSLVKSMGIKNLSALWKPAGHAFWAALAPTAECGAIIETVERFFGVENICLLSSPSMSFGSASGKVAWIKNNLPNYQRRFLIGPPKQFCAHADAVLIDDADSNVDAFREAGGYAVLYPQPWNSRHGESGYRVEVMAQELMALLAPEPVAQAS